MATIEQLVAQDQLIRFDPELGWREMEDRFILFLPKAAQWMTQRLPNESSSWNIELSPQEQFDDLAYTFCSGRELVFEHQVAPIFHIEHGIWELKTADLRLFGWFPRRDWFICSGVNTAEEVKRLHLYAGYRDEAVRRRDQLDLNPPKFLPGEDPNVVISAWCYPAP